jgi:hypothetical protein
MCARRHGRRHASERKTREAIVSARPDEKAIGAPTIGFFKQHLFRLAGGADGELRESARRNSDRNPSGICLALTIRQ